MPQNHWKSRWVGGALSPEVKVQNGAERCTQFDAQKKYVAPVAG